MRASGARRLENPWLMVGGLLSMVAAMLHLACIIGGADWYRFFGAGEEMARAAERGSMVPPLLTFCIAVMLALWAAYAFSGAGRIRRLPLLRTALIVISMIYLLRGLALVPIAFHPPARTPFNIWSSLVVLGFGITYAIGTWQAWPRLSRAAT